MKLTLDHIEQEVIAITTQFVTETGGNYAHKKITLDTSLQQHLGIDSLGRSELFMRIENVFGRHLADHVMIEADTLADIATALMTAAPKDPIQLEKTREKQTPEAFVTTVNVSDTKTLQDVLLRHALATPDRPHVYLQHDDGKEEMITFGKLLSASLGIAEQLRLRGLRPGDTVAIMLPTHPSFFYTFMGVLFAGCVPVPIYPPVRLHQLEAYAKQEAGILRNAEVRLLVTFTAAEQLSKLLSAFIPSLREVVTVDTLLQGQGKASGISSHTDDLALIQYTSGSTSAPKGVSLTHKNLLANIRAYGKAIQVTPQDITVSWVPLYHDMGLIGMWLGSLYYGTPLVLLSPITFLNRPEKWLWAIHFHRGTISGGPNFAYELCVRKIDPAYIEGLDLSSWRIAPNGAEQFKRKTLERFTKAFSPHGFKATTFLPVYGLAESSVCVAVSPLNRLPRIEKIERLTFEKEHRALVAVHPEQVPYLEFVACGIPIEDHAVRIVDPDNQPLPPRYVGHLQFSGPSSMQGYYANPTATAAAFHDGWWDTGDLAYLADGEIFITGRKKDLIIKAGRNLYPTEIESLTAEIDGVRAGCVIAFGTTDQRTGTEKLIIVAEMKDDNIELHEKTREAIASKIISALDTAPDDIVLIPQRTILKTSSGKLQRSACKIAYENGTLAKKNKPTWLQFLKLKCKFNGSRFISGLTAFAKALYTTYVLALLAIFLPLAWLWLWLLPRNTAATLCKAYARALFFLAGIHITLTGKQHLTAANVLIYAANHASYIDSLLLIAILPNKIRIVAKKELATIPIARTFIDKLDYLTVNRLDHLQGLEDTKHMERKLRHGLSLAMFPEGTCSYAAGLRSFKLGAFKLSADTEAPICPIAIQGTRHILRAESWLLQPGRIHVSVGDLIYPTDHTWPEVMRLHQLTREYLVQHCGEPDLDFITAGIAASRKELYAEKK